jgi:type II restriction/modification system DNA methylase subunit YeeA
LHGLAKWGEGMDSTRTTPLKFNWRLPFALRLSFFQNGTGKTINKSVNSPFFKVHKNTKATEVIPRWPFVFHKLAGAHFNQYWKENALEFETVEIAK